MRKRMVTRTIKFTDGVALIANIGGKNAGKLTDEKFTIIGHVKTDAKRLERVKEVLECDDIKVLNIKSYEETEKLYGMTEGKFVCNAIEIKKDEVEGDE